MRAAQIHSSVLSLARVGSLSLAVIGGLAPALLGGCSIGALVGGMAASAERSGSHQVMAKYSRLTDKSFAVVIAADRSVVGDQPELVSLLTKEITRRIAENAGAGGMVPAEDILRYQYQRPGWVALSPRDLAKELEVDRLIFIDLNDFSLNDPGNTYIWNGTAAGVVSVYESERETGGESAFREQVRVKYPDSEGLSEYQVPRGTVQMELSRRFVQRASWLFFEHEEPNAIKY